MILGRLKSHCISISLKGLYDLISYAVVPLPPHAVSAGHFQAVKLDRVAQGLVGSGEGAGRRNMARTNRGCLGNRALQLATAAKLAPRFVVGLPLAGRKTTGGVGSLHGLCS